MTARLLKCYGTCEKKYESTEMTKYKGANLCEPCRSTKEKETTDREYLYNMLKETFNLNFPTGLMLKQIKLYKDERQYSYRNIAFTVDYMFRLQKIRPQMQYGIALVPHYYDEMISYYKNLKRRRDNTVIEEQSVKRVVIKPFSLENTYRNKKMISMEDLLK